MFRPSLLPATLGFLASSALPQETPIRPKELGSIQWSRDLDAALAKKSDKPILLLFQEIPG